MAITGICLAAYQPLFFLGTERNGVAVGTVIALGSAPVLAGLLEWAMTRRAPSRGWVIATALATAGVVLLGVGGGGASSGALDALGLAASVGAGASFAIFANAQRRLMDAGWDPFTVAGAMGAGSAIVGAALLAFSLSFDDFIITNFVSGSETTFPKFVYVSYLRGIPAQANVIGFSMFVIAVTLVILAQVIGNARKPK